MRRPCALVVFLAAMAAFVATALTNAQDTLSVAWPPCDSRRVQMDLWHAPSGERAVMTVAVRNCLRRPLRFAALTVTAKQPLRMVGSSRRMRLRDGGHRAVWQIPTRPHATMWSVRIHMRPTGAAVQLQPFACRTTRRFTGSNASDMGTGWRSERHGASRDRVLHKPTAHQLSALEPPV